MRAARARPAPVRAAALRRPAPTVESNPSSGIALCLGISSCPTVRVDPDQFPDCGYRIAGGSIDLECLCGDSLCPMGSAASCLDAKALLSEESRAGGVRGHRRRPLPAGQADFEHSQFELR